MTRHLIVGGRPGAQPVGTLRRSWRESAANKCPGGPKFSRQLRPHHAWHSLISGTSRGRYDLLMDGWFALTPLGPPGHSRWLSLAPRSGSALALATARRARHRGADGARVKEG
jgi:hypothetical protein